MTTEQKDKNMIEKELIIKDLKGTAVFYAFKDEEVYIGRYGSGMCIRQNKYHYREFIGIFILSTENIDMLRYYNKKKCLLKLKIPAYGTIIGNYDVIFHDERKDSLHSSRKIKSPYENILSGFFFPLNLVARQNPEIVPEEIHLKLTETKMILFEGEENSEKNELLEKPCSPKNNPATGKVKKNSKILKPKKNKVKEFFANAKEFFVNQGKKITKFFKDGDFWKRLTIEAVVRFLIRGIGLAFRWLVKSFSGGASL